MHAALKGTRAKVIAALTAAGALTPELRRRVLGAASAGELDDLYSPFKPPAKGSLAARAKEMLPGLEEAVEELWSRGQDERLRQLLHREGGGGGGSGRGGGGRGGSSGDSTDAPMSPREGAMYLLAARIAALPEVWEQVMAMYVQGHPLQH